jgi:hypothetical protein
MPARRRHRRLPGPPGRRRAMGGIRVGWAEPWGTADEVPGGQWRRRGALPRPSAGTSERRLGDRLGPAGPSALGPDGVLRPRRAGQRGVAIKGGACRLGHRSPSCWRGASWNSRWRADLLRAFLAYAAPRLGCFCVDPKWLDASRRHLDRHSKLVVSFGACAGPAGGCRIEEPRSWPTTT